MRFYYAFLSCDHFYVNNRHIQDYLNDVVTKPKDVFFQCIPSYDNLETSKDLIDDRIDSSFYIVNITEQLNYMNSWELGYAMGKGLKVIVYPFEKNDIKIQENVRKIITLPDNIDIFKSKINAALKKLTPIEEVVKEDYDTQFKYVNRLSNGDS